ncbi:MAG: hypothetical protein ABL866_04500 [Devosia sp.]
MGAVIEFVPGPLGITREVAALRKLHTSLLTGYIVTDNGVDVTAREAKILGIQIAALDAAMIGVTGRRSDTYNP